MWRGLALCLDRGQSAYDLDGGYQMLLSEVMYSDEGTMRALYEASETMLTACPARTLDNLGSIDVAHATMHVIATMQSEGRADVSSAISKPHKYPEYWIPALALADGKLYDNYGNRLWNSGLGGEEWDFDINEVTRTFSIKVKDEDEPED